MRLIKKKWFVIVLALGLLLTFDLLAPPKGLLSRAIVIGCGLDFVGEELELTIQTVIPSKETNGKNEYAEFSAKAVDIEGAIAQIDSRIGIKTSFANAVLLVLGKGRYASYAPQLDYIMRSNLMPDITNIVASSISAKETLSQDIALNESTSFHILNIVNREQIDIGKNPTTIKNIAVQHNYLGGSVYLPYLVFDDAAKETTADESAELPQKVKEIIIDSTIVGNSQNELLLDKEQSVAFCLVNQKTRGGVLTITTFEGTEKEIKLFSSDCKLNFDKKTDTITACISLVLEKNYDNSFDKSISSTTEKAIIDKYSASVLSCFELCKSKQIDAFYLGEKMFSMKGEQWKNTIDNDWLNSISFDVKIKVKMK